MDHVSEAAARRPVMSDVARLAGVSLPTVSRVVNGGHWVGAETAARVQQAIDELGYRPNLTARALASRRSDVIGLLTHASTDYGPIASLFGVERAALEAGFGVLVASLDAIDRTTVQTGLDRLVESGVAGVVISAPWATEVGATREVTSAVPVVVASPVSDLAVPTVGFDEGAACTELVEHLLALGHTTVRHVGGPRGWAASAHREAGWERALRAAGAPVLPVVEGDWSARSGHRAARRLLAEAEPLTAVLAANDQMALGVLRALEQSGRRVPADVSVVGFDALPDSAYYSPPLTSAGNDLHELGRRSVAVLLDQVAAAGASAGSAPARRLGAGPGGGPPVDPVVLASRVSWRRSTAPPPGPSATPHALDRP